MNVNIGNIVVKGIQPDKQTRCKHYSKEEDIIAIKFFCCGEYYCCCKCHEELCDHRALQWPQMYFNKKAILCGACKNTLTVNGYMQCNYSCPHCQASFNPGCQRHYHLYFQI
ncbi:CHY zinc finger protein [Alteribacillus sp. JSM 102045]|uniref:CHY zinc finger protein n=1 Tax=Alteribacillus sp. JSM 102045 TaxID=1562101 RepID=UPI0035C16DFF